MWLIATWWGVGFFVEGEEVKAVGGGGEECGQGEGEWRRRGLGGRRR